MPQFPHHVFTMGTTGEAAAGVAGGGAYHMRRKRFVAYITACLALVLL